MRRDLILLESAASLDSEDHDKGSHRFSVEYTISYRRGASIQFVWANRIVATCTSNQPCHGSRHHRGWSIIEQRLEAAGKTATWQMSRLIHHIGVKSKL